MLGSDKVSAAIAHHRAIESVRYRATKDRQVERLAAQAEGSNVALFAEVDGKRVTFSDWNDIPRDVIRGVAGVKRTVRHLKDGETEETFELKIRDGVHAERALADLLGHNAPKEYKIMTAQDFAEAIGLKEEELPE